MRSKRRSRDTSRRWGTEEVCHVDDAKDSADSALSARESREVEDSHAEGAENAEVWPMNVDLLINFGMNTLKEGFKRVVNNYCEEYSADSALSVRGKMSHAENAENAEK